MRIWQITPRFFPSVCGVGDYARILGFQLQEDWGIESVYAVADSRHSAPAGKDASNLVVVGSRSAEDWLTALRKSHSPVDAVVVQASFYGYHPRGAPLWLARFLGHLKREGGPPVLTMFHELFATGHFTSLAFWYGFYQRWVLQKVAESSTAVRTNREASRRWLVSNTRHPDNAVLSLPVFSNLGEGRGANAYQSGRQAVLVAPGMHPGSRHWGTLASLAKSLDCSKVLVTGPKARADSITQDGITYLCVGVLGADEYSELLAVSRFGFLDYNPDFLAKSGLLAAFAAHGVVPILAQGTGLIPDGLEEGHHFLASSRCATGVSPALCDQIRATLASWYAGHAIRTTAASYARQLESMLELHPRLTGAVEF